MASPFWQCPQCHSVTRKNDNAFEMVEISDPNTVLAVPGPVKCPDCSANFDFQTIYSDAKYDVPIQDVYNGKHSTALVNNIRRLHEAGRIRLSEEEKRLLRQGIANLSGSAKADTSLMVRAQQWIRGHRALSLTIIGVVVIGALALVLFGPFRHGTPRVSVMVETGNKLLFGFIDDRGRVAIKPTYGLASDFSEGLASVTPQNSRKCGYINEQDEMVIQSQFDSCNSFYKGVARVQVAGKWGLVNRQGNVIVAPQIELKDSLWVICSEDLCRTKSGGKCGYINLAGESIIAPVFENCDLFWQSLAGIQLDGKWGFVDKVGKQVVKTQYDAVGSFDPEGLAPIKVGTKWGFIDKTGRQMIEPQYDNVGGFIRGLAVAKLDNQWGFIDKQGDWVIKPQYSHAYSFSGKLAAVQIGKMWGFVDHEDTLVIEPQYDEVSPDFPNSTLGYSTLVWIKKGDKWGVLDTDSRKVIIKPQFDDDGLFGDKGLARVKKDGKYGYVINTRGEVIWKPK